MFKCDNMGVIGKILMNRASKEMCDQNRGHQTDNHCLYKYPQSRHHRSPHSSVNLSYNNNKKKKKIFQKDGKPISNYEQLFFF